MKSYIEKMLHLKVNLTEYTNAAQLPLFLKAGYDLAQLHIAGSTYLLAKPKDVPNLVTLRKQRAKLTELSGMECILCFETISAYAQRKMLEEGIAFIVEGKQIYIPFLGMVLSQEKERQLPVVKQISFMTQRLLLTAIYEKWAVKTLTQAAKEMNVSKMTITRCFDELEGLAVPVIVKRGSIRQFFWAGNTKELYGKVKTLLRNPVLKEYRIEGNMPEHQALLGGMSAICSYSMLADNSYPTYAISKEDAKQLPLLSLVPEEEIPESILQVMAYVIPYGNKSAIDPISAVLSISKEEKTDPRVDAALDKILEEIIND